MHQKYRDSGLVLLSINASWDREGPARRFVDTYRLTFPVGRDADGRIGDLYDIDATPTTLFIGKDGKFLDRIEGAPDDINEIEARLEQKIAWLLAG